MNNKNTSSDNQNLAPYGLYDDLENQVQSWTRYNPSHVGAFNARRALVARKGFNQATVDDNDLSKEFSD